MTNSKLLIREASTTDLGEICTLKLKMFVDSERFDLLNDNPEKLFLEKYTELYDQRDATHFIAILDDNIVSMSGAFIKNDIPYCFYKKSNYGYIGDMYTIPNYRKKGIATNLLQLSINWLLKKDIQEIRLKATEFGRGIYEKNGFCNDKEEMFFHV